MREAGCTLEAKSAEECAAIESALVPLRGRIAGGTYSPDDESGDAHHFTAELAALCATRGVTFSYGTAIEALLPGARGAIDGVRLRLAGRAEFAGYDTTLTAARCDAILSRVAELFPGVADLDHATL